jgi:drug/metabolite transporter (DMT)-like permease
VTRARLLLLAAATLFSTGGAAIKGASLTSWQVASFRSGVAAVALLVLLPSARRGWGWRVWPVGAAYAATLVLFVLATRLTTSANAIFLQSTGPLYLLLLGPLLLHEGIGRRDLAFIAAVACGMALIFLGSDATAATAPNPPLGNRIGALCGVSWAFTLAGLRWLGKHGEGNTALSSVVAGNLIAFVAALPMAVPVARATWSDALVLLYLGVFQIGLAYVCMTTAIRHVPAFEASTLLLLEPALNPIWTWLAHGESPTAQAIAGGAVILLASLIHTARTPDP